MSATLVGRVVAARPPPPPFQPRPLVDLERLGRHPLQSWRSARRLDYLDQLTITRHVSFQAFDAWRRAQGLSLALLTTAAVESYTDHAFRDDEILLFGRESAGVPQPVHDAADVRLRIPIREGFRSLNIAVAVAMVAGEAMRQTGGFAAGQTGVR